MRALLIFFSLVILSPQARAGFLLFEPGVGYMQGHYDDYSASGIGFEGKLGFRWGSNFFIAGDAVYGMPALAATPPASGTGYAATLEDLGGMLGWNIDKFRITFTYIFSSKLSWTDSSGNPTSNAGSGYKFGIGGSLTDKLTLELDAVFDNYKTQTSNGTTTNTANFLNWAFVSLAWKVW